MITCKLLLAVTPTADNLFGLCRLTRPLGLQISELPLDPRLSAALLAAGRLGCAGDVATVAAMLCVQGVWFTGGGDRRTLEASKAK